MHRNTGWVKEEARKHFLLDEVKVKRAPLGDYWIVTVYKWRVGDPSHGVETGIDKSKSFIYKARIDGSRVVFALDAN